MAEDTPTTSVLGLTAQIVSAHVSNNTVSPDALPSLIQEVYKTLAGVGKEPAQPERPQPAVPVKKSVFHDHIVCLEDGKKLKMLKRHLKTAYNMTPEQYRERWGLGARLPDGCAQLRQAPFIAGQEDRPRHKAPRDRAGRQRAGRIARCRARHWTAATLIGYAGAAPAALLPRTGHRGLAPGEPAGLG